MTEYSPIFSKGASAQIVGLLTNYPRPFATFKAMSHVIKSALNPITLNPLKPTSVFHVLVWSLDWSVKSDPLRSNQGKVNCP